MTTQQLINFLLGMLFFGLGVGLEGIGLWYNLRAFKHMVGENAVFAFAGTAYTSVTASGTLDNVRAPLPAVDSPEFGPRVQDLLWFLRDQIETLTDAKLKTPQEMAAAVAQVEQTLRQERQKEQQAERQRALKELSMMRRGWFFLVAGVISLAASQVIQFYGNAVWP